jgi:mannose-6-phosphate isomerase-like protein (cupin superfamily)
MTVFRSDTAPPAWCELEGFEIITLGLGEVAERRPDARRERLIGTAGTTQIRRGRGSLLLKEAQFLDIDPAEGAWSAAGTTASAQLVRLSGRWGEEIAGCGIFRVTRSEERNNGDPVTYPKHTRIDRHYHDCDEYWIVLEGSGTAVVDDRHSSMGPGDCLAIGMGHHHDFPLVDSEVKAVFFETTLEGAKRTGHLWEHTHGAAHPVPERV